MPRLSEKKCSRCKIEMPLTAFYADKRSSDGLYSHCKACHHNGVAKWQSKNSERFKTQCAIWMKDHGTEKFATRRASRLGAFPRWADREAIKRIYAKSTELNKETRGWSYAVDHIVPLKSSIVCGLHVEANLQILPFAQNASKHNRYWPDMPEQEA